MGYGRGYGYGYGNMMGGGWLAGLMLLLFGALAVVLIVLLVIWAMRASAGHGPHGAATPPGGPGHHEAVAIAKRRLASGEITKEQYDEIMRALDGTS